MIIWNKENKKQAAVAAIFVAAGIVNGYLADAYVPAKVSLPETPIEEAVYVPEKTKTVQAETETKKIRKDANAYEPSITLLNLAYYFPEGADSSDVTQSYAGSVYQDLSIRDSDWLAAIYDLAEIKPAKMALQLGKPQSFVQGRYNPNDSAHDPKNPDTWTINTWKRVNVSFVNGNGDPINGYSNVKEILSMASVYTYQKDMLDAEAFKEYANRLWKDSHSYSYSISDVYYCQGCLDMSMEELVQEAEEEELAGELAASGIPSGTEKKTEKEQEQREKETKSEETSEQEANESSYAEPNDAIILETALDGETAAPAGGTIRKSTVDPTQWDNIGPGEEPMATPENASYDTAETSPEEETAAEFSKEEAFAETTEAALLETTKAAKQPLETEPVHKNDKCPGHVNLNITIQILGFDDPKGLVTADPIGNDPENMEEGGWDGWDDYSLKMVQALLSQDWYEDYGLSISTINMRNPLSAAEIDAYMDNLPADTSKERREIIQFALYSVGKVPYYWGGKASRSGYEGNFFGTPVEPDTKGRILKGLDCSGWINWVYWSVTGERLAGESTSSLILCGRPIQRSELKPGDIIIKTGTGAHVVMFLGWTSNGQMQVIHESSASVNNVTVKTMTADWPYYRNLID